MNQNIQPMAYKQKHDSNKEDGKWSHCCVSCSAGPQREDHPLTGSTVPSSQTANSTALLFPTHSNLTTEPCTVFILRSQYLNDHELTRLACVFQNAILPSKHNKDWKDRPNFYKLRGNSEIST